MTRLELSDYLPPYLADVAKFGGMVYASPTRAWVEGPFYDYLKKLLWNFGEDTWAVKWQCRDFARAYATFAQLANAQTPDSPKGIDALSIGEIWFHPDHNAPGDDHAINIIVADRACFFIDPQTGLEWAMSTAEIASVSFLRF